MHIIEIFIFSFLFIVIVVSQLSHIAIKALKKHAEEYDAAGKPEPGWTVGLMNWRFTQYLLGGNFQDIEDEKCIAKLKRARVGVLLSFSYFILMVFYLLLLN